MTHATSHTLALQNAAWSCASAHRTWATFVLVRAVSTTIGLEAPTLNSASKALTLGSASDIYFRTLSEQFSGQFLTWLIICCVLRAHLSEVTTRSYTSLCKMTGQWLGHLGRINLAITELYCAITVRLYSLYSGNYVSSNFNQSYGDEEAVFIPNLRHTQLATEQCSAILILRHFLPLPTA